MGELVGGQHIWGVAGVLVFSVDILAEISLKGCRQVRIKFPSQFFLFSELWIGWVDS